MTLDAKLYSELNDIRSMDAENARALSAEFYTSPDVLRAEEDAIFRSQWVCLGHVGEIPGPGDFYTTELVSEQLIVVRGESGDISVFSNVCRHRGNLVAQGRGNQRNFTCGYHAWVYGTDGSLKAAPLMKGVAGFSKEKCGLHAFKTDIWQNFIFVNLDGTAEPLTPQMGQMDALMKNYHHELRHLNFMEEDVWDTNWKSLAENFSEGYHLSATHLKTLHPITPTKLCKKTEFDPAYTAYHAFYDPKWPDRGPFHEDLTALERRNSILSVIFPCFLLSIATHYTLFMCLRPAGVGKVAIRWGVVGFGTDSESQSVKDYVDLCRAFNAEDREKLEILHRALHTRYYKPGPLAPTDFEGPIWDFIQYFAHRFEDPSNG